MAEELSNLVETLSIDDTKENNTTKSQVIVEEKAKEKEEDKQ